MKDKQKITAIILVAGNSTRFGKNRNKNFEIVCGKSVLEYSLNAFDINEYIDNIIVACKLSEVPCVKEIIEKQSYNKNIDVMIGGDTRSKSVYNCIKNINSDIVIIHDGARPLIKQEYINQLIESMKEFKGATIGVKSKDTIKIVNENNIILQTTVRDYTWMIQTPQCFKRETLVNVHEKYNTQNVTDDCSLLERDDYNVKVIEGDYTNIKITTYEDLDVVKTYMNGENYGKL